MCVTTAIYYVKGKFRTLQLTLIKRVFRSVIRATITLMYRNVTQILPKTKGSLRSYKFSPRHKMYILAYILTFFFLQKSDFIYKKINKFYCMPKIWLFYTASILIVATNMYWVACSFLSLVCKGILFGVKQNIRQLLNFSYTGI